MDPRDARVGLDCFWPGVAIAVVVGVATPAVPLLGFFVGAVLMRSHAGGAQIIAYVVAWACFAVGRVIPWEIPSLPARFVWGPVCRLAAAPVPGRGDRHGDHPREVRRPSVDRGNVII